VNHRGSDACCPTTGAAGVRGSELQKGESLFGQSQDVSASAMLLQKVVFLKNPDSLFLSHNEGFQPIQLQLLRPALILLESTIRVLQQALIEDDA
jgi:hypothetical protein